MELVRKAENELKSCGGRILLRYSGTEPKARLLLEGDSMDVLQKWANQISEAIKRQIGA
jgi:phosphoglucosamine mutase